MDINKWRYAGRPLTVFGVPVISFLVYFIWFPFPSVKTFVICTCVVLFYFLLAMMGYTLPVLYRSFSGLSAEKNLPGGRGGTGALSDNT
jgi:intracellular multiplication protein IcmT